jgi:hypothetical protein
MKRDKKVQKSHIRLILLDDLEAPVAYTVEDEKRLSALWKQTIDTFS